MWITRGPRAEIEPRQSAARTPLVDPRVAISQIDPGHERNLFLSSPCDPRSSPPSSSLSLFPSPPLSVLEPVKLTHVLIIIAIQLTVPFFFEGSVESRCRLSIAQIVAVSRKTVASTIASSAWISFDRITIYSSVTLRSTFVSRMFISLRRQLLYSRTTFAINRNNSPTLGLVIIISDRLICLRNL